jgi:hypothetical protein
MRLLNVGRGIYMANHSTRRALNMRAVGTANWLEMWAEILTSEMKKHDVDLWPKRSHGDFGPSDDEQTITLERGEVRSLIMGMHERIAEIRKFAEYDARVSGPRDVPFRSTQWRRHPARAFTADKLQLLGRLA